MEWALLTLMFIFGYITCKVSYFIKATRASVLLLKAAQLVSLGLLARAMEDFYYAKIYRMEKMIESQESDHNISAFSYRMEEELAAYKKKSVQGLIELHPSFFKEIVEFDDWASGMEYLKKNEQVVQAFFSRREDD